MKSLSFLTLFIFVFATYAATVRTIEGDQVRTSDRTKTFSFPAASTTFVGTTSTQTLTNKTLTSPVINTPTGIVKGDVGLGNVDNTSDATKNAASVVLTNKDIDGGTASNTSRITIPKAAKTTLDALTRKQGTILYDTTSNKPYYDDGSNLKVIGSGAGGSVNLIENGNADDVSTTIFTAYQDSASSRPTDGAGGTTDLTSSVSSTNPLTGTKSFILTKPTSNNQGHGWSIPFTVDNAYKAKVLNIKVKYLLVNGNLTTGTSSTDSDLIWYIYDVTNSKLIEPSSFKLLSNSTSISDEFVGSFQTSATGTNYRLIAHITTSSLTDFNLKVEVEVSPSTYSYGTPITDWTSFTPTGSWVTATNYSGRWRRVGDVKEYQYFVTTTGAPTAAALTVNLPSGDVIDTTKMTILSNEEIIPNSVARILDVGTAFYSATVAYNNTTSVRLKYIDSSTTFANQAAITNTAPMAWSASDTINFSFSVPIVGLSSSVQMSEQTDTRVVSFLGGKSGGSQVVTGSITDITFAAEKDTHGGWTGSTYVVRVPGDYIINSTVYSVSAVANILLYKNGVNYTGLLNSPANIYTSGSALMHGLVAGDIISIRSATNITVAGDATIKLGISRISGPNQIAANELVAAKAYKAAAQTGIATNGSAVKLTFDTKEFDSHGAFDTTNSRFISNISGTFLLNANAGMAGTNVLANTYYLAFYKNGSLYQTGQGTVAAAGTSMYLTASTSIRLVAGDYVEVFLFGAGNNSVSTLSTQGGSTTTTFSITRAGF